MAHLSKFISNKSSSGAESQPCFCTFSLMGLYHTTSSVAQALWPFPLWLRVHDQFRQHPLCRVVFGSTSFIQTSSCVLPNSSKSSFLYYIAGYFFNACIPFLYSKILSAENVKEGRHVGRSSWLQVLLREAIISLIHVISLTLSIPKYLLLKTAT